MLYLQVTKYEGNRKLEWDNFVKSSKNGHFFFYRDYMEYHSDRFQDFSLIIYNDKGNITALPLPEKRLLLTKRRAGESSPFPSTR